MTAIHSATADRQHGWRRCLLVFTAALLAAFTAPAIAAGTLKVGVQLEPPNLDPTQGAAAAVDEIVYANVFEGLTRITENGAVAPALAAAWEVSGDGRVYEFILRENIFFHDGTSFDAEDVVFSLNRARAENSANAQRALFSLIDDIAALSPSRVRISLKEPLGALPVYLAWGDAVIVAPESAANNARSPVGTGPFKFQQWRKGASITLDRNNDYWGTPASLDQIQYYFIPDPTAAFAALMAGDVDGFPNYPAAENLALIERDDRFQIIFGTSEGETILAINNKSPPFDDIRIRQALSHAINKQDIIDAALFGYGTPIGSHFSPHHPAYIDLSGRYPYDPARARTLLTEAGYPNGFTTTLTLPPPAYARRSGEVIAAQLADIGVVVQINNLEWAQWLDQVFANKAFDLTVVSHTEPLDIDIYARDNYYFQYENDGFDTIIEDLRRARDPAARDALFKSAQSLIAEDAVNVFLAQAPKIAVWSKDVSGVWANAPIQANDLTGAAIEGGAYQQSTERRQGNSAVAVLFFLIAALLAYAAFYIRARPTYLIGRAAGMVFSLIAASIVVFLIIEAAPGDPAAFMMGLNASPASVAALKNRTWPRSASPCAIFFMDWRSRHRRLWRQLHISRARRRSHRGAALGIASPCGHGVRHLHRHRYSGRRDRRRAATTRKRQSHNGDSPGGHRHSQFLAGDHAGDDFRRKPALVSRRWVSRMGGRPYPGHKSAVAARHRPRLAPSRHSHSDHAIRHAGNHE